MYDKHFTTAMFSEIFDEMDAERFQEEVNQLVSDREITELLSENFIEEMSNVSEPEFAIDLCLMELDRQEVRLEGIDRAISLLSERTLENPVHKSYVMSVLVTEIGFSEEELKVGGFADRAQQKAQEAKKRVTQAVQKILDSIRKFLRGIINNDKATIKKGNAVVAALKKKGDTINGLSFKGRAGLFVLDQGIINWSEPPKNITDHLDYINGIDWKKWIDSAVTVYSEHIDTASKVTKLIAPIATKVGGKGSVANLSMGKGQDYNMAVKFVTGKAPADMTAVYEWSGTLAQRVNMASFDRKTTTYSRGAVVKVVEKSIECFDQIQKLYDIMDDKSLVDQIDGDGNIYHKNFTKLISTTTRAYVKYYRTFAKAGIALGASALKSKDKKDGK